MKLLTLFANTTLDRVDRDPAIAHLSAGVRAQLQARCTSRIVGDGRYWADAIPVIAAYLCVYVPLIVLLLKQMVNPLVFAFAQLPIIFGLTALTARMRRRALRRALAAELFRLKLRPSECVICRYSLGGIDSLACPECGEAIAPPRSAEAAPAAGPAPTA